MKWLMTGLALAMLNFAIAGLNFWIAGWIAPWPWSLINYFAMGFNLGVGMKILYDCMYEWKVYGLD